MDTITQYDPNHQFGTTTVELTLCCWDYVGTFTVELRGNVKGIDLLRHAGEVLLERCYNDDGLFVNPIWLAKPGQPQERLMLGPDEGDEDILETVVSARIVGFAPYSVDRAGQEIMEPAHK